jgi:hypothetical protein
MRSDDRDQVTELPHLERSTASHEITRRRLLAAGGATAAGGLLVVGLPDFADAALQRRNKVGAGLTDRRTVGLVLECNQVATSLTGFGYLTRVQGLAASVLSTRPPAKNSIDPRSSDPSAARFTVLAVATLEAVSHMGSVITTIGSGSMRIFYQPGGGATFADPASFGRGQEIAAFQLGFQNNLALDDPNKASVRLTADLSQLTAPDFRIDGSARRFGQKGLPWNLQATGRGQRTEPTAPRSQFWLSADLGVVDASPRR